MNVAIGHDDAAHLFLQRFAVASAQTLEDSHFVQPSPCSFALVDAKDMNVTVGAQQTVLHHKAELHWNIFGDHPRMFRGTITRDRYRVSFLPPWLFRPVIGSFTGIGTGQDTADTSYAYRQMDDTLGGRNGGPPPKVAPQTDRY